MKILHLHHSLTSGGIEAMITGLANTMAETETVDVCLMYPPKETDIFVKKLRPEIRVWNLGKKGPGFSFKMPFKTAWFLARNKYDVVQMHGFFYYYMLAALLFHRRMKFVYTVHNDAPLENTRWDKKIFSIKKAFFRWGWVHPITISDGSQDSFKALYPGCDNTKIFNGIPAPVVNEAARKAIDRYRLTPKTKVFFNPGRICLQKNQLVLVKVFSRLIEEGKDIALIIAGQCQDNEVFKQLEPYFSERIVYAGEIDDIPSLLKFSDGMVLPSIFEGLPVVLLESIAVGCPPICSPVGGVPDIVKNGYNGLLSTDSTELAYYNAMCQYLSMTEEERRKMCQNAVESFGKYEIHNTVSNYLIAYKNF